MIIEDSHIKNARESVLTSVSDALDIPTRFTICENVPEKAILLDAGGISQLGLQMILHHAFTTSAFNKFAFEYGMEKAIQISGKSAELASQGNPGHDISVEGQRLSLKTEAANTAKSSHIHISKWMELGKNPNWSDDPKIIPELVNEFMTHMLGYERILVLRYLPGKKVNSQFSRYYELIEIPKDLLLMATGGECEMKLESRQNPKPGYCHVKDALGNTAYSLYFDGGGERKLQIKALDIHLCIRHASWEF